MTSIFAHAPPLPARSRDPAAEGLTAATATYTLHVRDKQARNATRHVPGWLDQIRRAGVQQVSIDLSDVHRLDFTGFGVLLTKLRDVLRVTVLLTNIGVSEAVSLRSMGFLEGIAVENRHSGASQQLTRPSTTRSLTATRS